MADCIICGRQFELKIENVRNPHYKGICCSRQCAATYRKQRGDFDGANNSAWRGGKVKRSCLYCGVEFGAKPLDVKRGFGNYCSKSCKMIHKHKLGCFNVRPNNPEKQLIDLIAKHGLPFKYVGAGEVWLGNHNPDFINTNGRKQVIEVFGTYWHPVFDVALWTEHYKKYGFDVLIIWEDEFKQGDRLLKKLKQYAASKTI